jgi:hypothetical protein
MIHKTFSLQLDGTVSLDRFADAIGVWRDVLRSLSDDLPEGGLVSMQISNLSAGSALVDIDVEFDHESHAEKYQMGFREFGSKIRNGNIYDLPLRQQQPARKLQEVATLDGNGGISISSELDDILIIPPSRDEQTVSLKVLKPLNTDALGFLVGKLQSINSRHTLRVVIYDAVHDRAVRATVSNDQHETLRNLWDKDVIVEGLIRRDSTTGLPLSIRNITRIAERKATTDKYAWLKARGALQHINPEASSEELIRQARNA